MACTPQIPDIAPDTEPERVFAQGAPIPRQAADLPSRELPPRAVAATPPPLRLTASDGTGLALVSLRARAVVQGPLAFTELHLTFDNPDDRTIEGRFTIDLPPDSAISRFAMKIGPRWQEGEVVERQAARVAYEDFLHRKQDPALLENETGNRFSARVFPIPSRGRKELVLSYSQELSDSAVPYKLPLAGLPQLEKLDVEILVDTPQTTAGAATSIGGTAQTRQIIRLNKANYVPDRDLAVTADKADTAVGLRSGEIVVVRVPVTGSMPPDTIENLTILFDTSASRALDFGGQVRRLGELVAALRAESAFRLRVVAFDQEVSLVFEGDALNFGAEALDTLYSRQALGASDLSGALRSLSRGGPTQRVVIMGDGIATAGLSEVASLTQAVAALERIGVERLDAVIDGGLQDRDTLAALATAGLARDGIVVEATLPVASIAKKLSRATLSNIGVSVPGSTFSWPRTLNGVQPGDEALVYAKIPEGAAMEVVLEGDTQTDTVVPLLDVSRPLVHRALIGAQIASMTLRRSELGVDKVQARKELADGIVELSTKHRVLSDFTALLVLETEADYARFQIDRNARTDILEVGATGLALRSRARELARPWEAGVPRAGGPPDPVVDGVRVRADASRSGVLGSSTRQGHFMGSPSAADDVWGSLTDTEVGEAFGVGGLGLVGTGRGGGGVGEGKIGVGNNVGLIGKGGGGGTGWGYGRGLGSSSKPGARAPSIPRIRQARAEVTGSLDKNIIRRIVRSHLNELRSCYNKGLRRDPGLAGRVTVRFEVGGSGRVAVARIAETTLPDSKVSVCIVRAVRGWRFPEPPGGGTVIVRYPFVMGSGGPAKRLPVPSLTPEELEAARLAEEARAAEARRRAQALARLEAEAERTKQSPYEGRMFDVMALVEHGDPDEALAAALRWRAETPGDVLALLAVGEALEKLGRARAAARAYGSIIDLFPSRADLRRFAGSRLDRLGEVGRSLAIDTYRHALAQRPDHPNSHRQYAYALLRGGQPDSALDAIITGAGRTYPSGRFRGVGEILTDDVGLIAAAWINDSPAQAQEIRRRVHAIGATVPTSASTRFVVSWETDANDVDFHVYDGRGGHAFFSEPELASGGRLYADVTTGYGPECFTISGVPTAFPYRLEAHYYSRGPMGYGMGTLQIVQHDGRGGLSFDDRPFVIMKDGAFVKLGQLSKPLP